MTKAEQDAAFAELNLNGVTIHNTEHEADGRFRRFVTTPGGVFVTLSSDFPFDHIVGMCEMLDQVAEANYAAGKCDAQRAMRDSLGLQVS